MSVNPFETNNYDKYDKYSKEISSQNTFGADDVSEINEIDTSGSIYADSPTLDGGNYGLSLDKNSEIDEQTYGLIKEQLQNEIEQKKQALSDEKDNRGWATSLWNGAKELFGGGDKKDLNEINDLEKQLESLETKPQNLSQVYKSVMDKDLDVNELSKLQDSTNLVASFDSSTKQAIIDELENQCEQIEQSFNTAKDSNGWISGTWDKFKNWTGIGASSDKTQTSIDNMKKEIEELKKILIILLKLTKI